MKNKCLFCNIDNKICENELFYSRWDKFPVSKGHALVIPKEHIESFFKLNDKQIIKLYDLIKQTKEIIQEKYNPDAYNIWLNNWIEAWRSIHHLHIHIIPRYKWDVENPKWWVRHIIPWKGFY